MDRTNLVQIVAGAVGVLATYAVAPPGENILILGVLRFDLALAVITGFVFLTFWGIAMSVRRLTAFQARVESLRFNPTEIAVICSLSLAAGVLAYMQTGLTGVSLVATVVVSVLLTVVVLTGGFILFHRFGWGHLGNENKA